MRRILVAGGLIALWLVLALTPSAGAEMPALQRKPTATPTPPANLLVNSGFEAGSARQWNAMNNAWANGQIATGWMAWWRQPTGQDGKYPGRCPPEDAACQPWHAPEYRETRGILYTPPRVRSGDNSQMYFTSLGLYEGGLYQRVTGVPVGWRLSFSIWARAWSASDTQNMAESSGQPGLHMKVGVDPNGGVDPWSADVVWGKESDSFDRFSLYSVDATARSDSVTVFFYSKPERALKHVDVMLDDAGLVLLGPPPPTPVIIDSPNRAANAPTPAGSPQAAPPRTVVHIIQPGDTLFAIAQAYRVDLGAIYAANGLNETSVLKLGQSIIIPLPVATAAPTAIPTLAPTPVIAGTLCVGAFEDTSGDGRYDETDNALSGAAFLVADRSGGTVAASDAGRCFSDLPVGAYSVIAQVPAGFTATTETRWGVALTEKTRVDVMVGIRQVEQPVTDSAGGSGIMSLAVGAGSIAAVAAVIALARRRSNHTK